MFDLSSGQALTLGDFIVDQEGAAAWLEEQGLGRGLLSSPDIMVESDLSVYVVTGSLYTQIPSEYLSFDFLKEEN